VTRHSMRSEPPEVAALLNPALIALLIIRAADGHDREAGAGLPFIYAPIIATLALYPDVRDTLTMNITTQFVAWIDRSSSIQIHLREKIADMVPIVNEGLIFGLASKVLRIDSGAIVRGDHGPTLGIRAETADMEEAQRAAYYLGRWLVRAGNPAGVCAMLGVAP
jgi:Family of unknown function (DUF6521)